MRRVNGEIRKMPPSKVIHADTVENLADLLKAKLDRSIVRVLVTTFGLVIRREPPTTWVPDIAVFILSNVVEKDGYIHSAPELVVEVLSPANSADCGSSTFSRRAFGHYVIVAPRTTEAHPFPRGRRRHRLNLAQIKSAECGEAPGAVNQLLIANR